MNGIMQNIITTNLRIPDEELRQHRVMAAELGISFNDLVLDALRANASTAAVRRKSSKSKSTIEYTLDQLPQLPQLVREAERRGSYENSPSTTKRKKKNTSNLSAEDVEIYE